MGMFDTLISDKYEAQVKTFYHPVYGDEGFPWHSGGRLECFEIGEEVPTKTQYYSYPDNFYIVLYDFDDYDLAVIEDKKFTGFIKDCNNVQRIYPVYDTLGNRIKIHSVQDFNNHRIDFNNSGLSYGEYAEKWVLESPLWYNLGELHYCWQYVKSQNDKIAQFGNYQIDYKKRRLNIERDIRKFIQQHPEEYQGYLELMNIPYLIEEGV